MPQLILPWERWQQPLDKFIMTNLLRLIILILITLPYFSFGQDPCYSMQTSNCKKGYLGKIMGQNLFYELWTQPGAAGTKYNAIILRTDTVKIPDNLDFCIDFEGQTDSIDIVRKYKNATIYNKTIDVKVIPTLFQILTINYGYQITQSIHLKGNQLFLSLTEHPNLADKVIVTTEIYGLRKGKFHLVKKSIKTNKA